MLPHDTERHCVEHWRGRGLKNACNTAPRAVIASPRSSGDNRPTWARGALRHASYCFASAANQPGNVLTALFLET
eukprot:5024623-Pleurochrysis_carterae.AAC.2